MAPPSVSVIMATYDHEAYVAEAIRSVLEQSHSDFEFLIVDDASHDGTPEVVKQFSDPRIVFWRGSDNLGSSARRNELIARAQGRYIAVQNSDDVWAPDKLALQFAFLEANPWCGATFSRIAYIDANGTPLWPDIPTPFDEESRTSGLWLRRLFVVPRNCFAHPSVMIRRVCHDLVGGYDIRLRQIPDSDMWVRLLKRYTVHVTAKVLVKIRWHGRNVSYTEPIEPRTRWYNEKALSSEAFFDGMSKDLLVEGFSDLLVFKDPPSEEHCDIEKALIYLAVECSLSPLYKVTGMRRLYDLFSSPQHQALLINDYRIDGAALQQISGRVDTFLRAVNWTAAEEQQHKLERRVAELESALETREARVEELEFAAAEHHATLSMLRRMAAERDSMLTKRTQALEKAETRIADLSEQEQLLGEAQTRIITLSAQMAERERQLDAIYASTSWRVTAPLRGARRLIRLD